MPRPERAQRGRRVERAGADLHVVGLQDDAAVVRPVALQRQDQALERAAGVHVINCAFCARVVGHDNGGKL